MSCIDVNHLSKLYGSVKAVDDVELLVERGQVFGFLGPNGAGKSTIIKLLTTLIPPSSGTLSILGIDAVKNPLQVRHKIGVVLQQPSYEPTLSVEKSLDKYGMMWNVPRVERKKRLEHLLKDFDLVEIRKKRTEDLSIGQRRRVQVAREFMHDMDLLFLDEPTVGLDPNARRKLLDYLKNKVKTGLTIFYTTHILTEAEYLCDKIAIIDKGKIIARVLSISPTENGKNMILGVDNKRNLYNISDFSNSTSICVEGDIIECMPSKIYGNSITLDENSFVRKLDNDESIPSLSQLRTKINDVKIDKSYCIESIILKVPERREVQTKSGESILLSEMFVEDDTGQIWVKGWRNQARLTDKCELGEIVSITGLNAKAGLEGRIELFLTAFSKIIKKN